MWSTQSFFGQTTIDQTPQSIRSLTKPDLLDQRHVLQEADSAYYPNGSFGFWLLPSTFKKDYNSTEENKWSGSFAKKTLQFDW